MGLTRRLKIHATPDANMSLIPSAGGLKPRMTMTIARAGKMLIHHCPGRYAEPSAIIVPMSGVGACAPSPTKLREAPMRTTHPQSSVTFVRMEPRLFGSISLNMMCHRLAPTSSAALTKSSFLIEEDELYTSLVYQGHHASDTASMALIALGVSTEAIERASRSGGTATNMSASRMITALNQRLM